MNILASRMGNAVYVTSQLLKMMKVKVNTHTLLLNLKDHPEYPSLLAISDCLSELKVDNYAYNVEKRSCNLSDLSFPFITYFSSDVGRFILVRSINNSRVIISNEKDKNLNISEQDFSLLWSGVVLYAEANKESGEKKYYQNLIPSLLQQIVLPVFLISLTVLFISIFNLHKFNWPSLFLCLTKFLGMAMSLLLLVQSINANHPFITKLCGVNGKNTCHSVLSSKEAKITKWLNWSEVGFFYFSSSFLIVLIFPVFVSVLSWLNLFALPFTAYSLNYQYRTKNWCILCCTIQVILITEFIIFSTGYNTWHIDLHINLNILFFLFCFLLPIVIWALLKPILLRANSAEFLSRQLNIFKYNNELFNLSLNKQPHYQINGELMPIILGNPNANTIITIVSNPFCFPCTKAHNFIDDWLQLRNDLQIKLLFANNNKDDDLHTKVSLHLMAISLSKDTNMTLNALSDWYNQNIKSYESWSKKYPVIITDEVRLAGYRQRDWCEMAKIDFTPTILINGHKLPEPYRINDLKYLIN